MRRSEKEVKDLQEIEAIINGADICRLAMCEDQKPYIVPMNFGYSNHCLYFHSAKEGKKIDILNKNPKVCFEMEVDLQLVKGEMACDCSMKFKSVIGFGKASMIEEFEEKKEALSIIMRHYTQQETFEFKERAIHAVTIIKVEIEEISGKKSGY